MRPGIDKGQVEALKRLMREARKDNTIVSLHINIQQAARGC